MWLKLTTDGTISAQPSGYINIETGVVASAVAISGTSYYGIVLTGSVGSPPLDGQYATQAEAQAALQSLLHGVTISDVVG